MTGVPAVERRRRLAATLTAVVAGAVFTVAVVTGDQAPGVDRAEVLSAARTQSALCQAQLDTATTTAQRTRARDCLADMARVIRALEPEPTPEPTATGTATPPGPLYPTEATAGVPAGWAPTTVRTSDLRVTQAGAVVQDVRLIGADLIIDAANVTVRRVEVLGGRVNNLPGDTCRNGLVLEQVTVARTQGQITRDGDPPAVGTGGYTARSVKVVGVAEGFRVGGAGCGPVTIEDSYAAVAAPGVCTDWHGDALQGYGGPPLTVRNTVLKMVETSTCRGTAPFFYPAGQDNTSATVDRLIVQGGGFVFRLGTPATVTGLGIVEGSWAYGPIDVRCSAVTEWEAAIVRLDPAGQPVPVRAQECNTEDGT